MKEIRLSRGQVAIVDDADYPALSAMAWHAHWNNGARRWEAGHSTRVVSASGKATCKHIRMCQFLLGEQPRGVFIDHRNGNPLDNQRDNLRLCSRLENNRNRRKHRHGKLPYKGLRLVVGGKYQARITPEAAAKAYNKAAIEHYGEFALLNGLKEAA